jgi:hypothetical protein
VTPKRLYNFMIEPEMAAALKRLKETRPDVSEGQLVRQAIREFLEREGVAESKGVARARKRPTRS